MSLLEVKNLTVELAAPGKNVEIVSRLSFHLERGEILALVGESGCGKSLSCLALTRLLPPGLSARADSIAFQLRGTVVDLASVPARELRRIRGGGIGYIFQEPAMSLNPVFRIGDQIAESILLHRPDVADVKEEVIRLLREVGIPDPETRIRAYPHELSGGMQQRVMIAMALAGAPELLVADEPTTALDVTIQAQILSLISAVREQKKMTVILVTHNLGVVAETADRVAVMYAGMLVESAPVQELFRTPKHPYTAALLRAVPRLGTAVAELETIRGSVPPPNEYPAGCRFFSRCERIATRSPAEQARCMNECPEMSTASPEHFFRCFFPEGKKE